MNSKGFARVGIILMVLTSAAAMMGVGFGMWQELLTISETVETGNVNIDFIASATDDNGIAEKSGYDDEDDNVTWPQDYDVQWGALSSADPRETGPDALKDPITGRWDKDVARCDADIVPNPGDNATITKQEVYPGYNCTAWFDIGFTGTVPIRIVSVTLTTISGSVTVAPDPLASPTLLDLDNADSNLSNTSGADIEVLLSGIELCEQIDPGAPDHILTVEQVVLEDAPQGLPPVTWTMEIYAEQWNAVGDTVIEGDYGPECAPL